MTHTAAAAATTTAAAATTTTTTTNTTNTTTTSARPPLHVQTWGEGTPVILAHGSLATGADEWEMQRPLAEAGYRLTVIDRRGYGGSAGAPGEDFLADAEDIAELMDGGAHLVGHSYGGLGVLLAAARRPAATLSLTVLEPAVAQVATSDPAWQQLTATVRTLWDADLPAREWVVRFLSAVGSDPDELPGELLDSAVDLLAVLRRGRPFFDCDVPLADLAVARFPKLVVSGGHHAGFDAMCRELATGIGAELAVVTGAGHEVQFTGAPLNELLADLWGRSWPCTAAAPVVDDDDRIVEPPLVAR